jgi:hypothetical protein
MVMTSYFFWNITPLVRWKSADVSGHHVASICRVQEEVGTLKIHIFLTSALGGAKQ